MACACRGWIARAASKPAIAASMRPAARSMAPSVLWNSACFGSALIAA
jgi:hypothetical protein